MQKVWQRQALNVDQPRDIQSNSLPQGNFLRGLSQAPMPNLVQSFPVIIEENSFPEQIKNIMPIVRNYTALDNRTAIKVRTKN